MTSFVLKLLLAALVAGALFNQVCSLILVTFKYVLPFAPQPMLLPFTKMLKNCVYVLRS